MQTGGMDQGKDWVGQCTVMDRGRPISIHRPSDMVAQGVVGYAAKCISVGWGGV